MAENAVPLHIQAKFNCLVGREVGAPPYPLSWVTLKENSHCTLTQHDSLQVFGLLSVDQRFMIIHYLYIDH